MFLTVLKTGMRVGELLALRWSDVDLTNAVIRVRWSFTGGRLTSPKNHERRDVDLPPILSRRWAPGGASWADRRTTSSSSRARRSAAT